MELIILMLLVVCIFSLYLGHQDHKALAEGLDTIINHLNIEEEEKKE